ncbi:MAG: phosphopentomutase [Lachnospiraceae bacterium]|nr:phosphopentomutase [Lachnospiraceae bacterium]
MIQRVIWIVLDSVGMGALPDASDFDDVGANTIGHTVAACGGLQLPNLQKLGYGNIDGMLGIEPVEAPIGAYGRLAECSNGKDTTIGHWEMIGIHTPIPFPTYPQGFPEELMQKFLDVSGCKGYLGNCVASGTQIIQELGDEHVRTGYPIIYTSADSVFQIAASEDVIPPEQLYEICRAARGLLTDEHNVARVIARPFVKDGDTYVRTANRRDFSRKPSEENLLCYMKEAGLQVAAVGKIEDIFDGVGITQAVHTKDNMDGMDQTLRYMQDISKGLIFTNLVEFDSKWGHRRDALGYGAGLEAFDRRLAEVLEAMETTDLLVITADHGCDPTFKGTDHTREYVPVLWYSKLESFAKGVNLGTGKTFANIGQTIGDLFGVKSLAIGESQKGLLL